ncbi:MAG: efflux RND transporter periplasmic adaptor subunit, partial [Ignavibacterium sp.]|nr:efflux RND transporter periplasmic adaptor subunit [Ignavibacterium sp.]
SKNEIVTGQTLGSYVEVISGLKSGQKVISTLSEKVKDGVEVNLAEQ